MDAGSKISAEVVRTRELQVVDHNDLVRAVISTTEDGGVGLILFDETGKQRAEVIHQVTQHSALQFRAADGTPRLGIFASDHADTGIMLNDTLNHLRAVISVDPERNARIGLQDREGHARISLSMTSEGAASLILNDDLSRPRLALNVNAASVPLLMILDENGDPILALPIQI